MGFDSVFENLYCKQFKVLKGGGLLLVLDSLCCGCIDAVLFDIYTFITINMIKNVIVLELEVIGLDKN